MTNTIFAWLSRYGTWILPAGLALGLAWQELAAIARPILPVTVFAMLTLLLTRLDIPETMSHIRRPRLIIAALIWAVVIVPALLYLVLAVWPVSDGLHLALIIYGSSPPNFATSALAWILGLNGNLATIFTLGAITLHPIATPLLTEAFSVAPAQLTAFELAARLAGLIGAAAIASAVFRRFLPPERRRQAEPAFDAANVIIMLIFAVALMDGIPARIIAQPVYAMQLIALCFALHFVLNAASYLLWRCFAGIQSAATLAYCIGGRNIAIAMSVLGTSAPDDAWLFFAMLQFPVYVLPMLMRPIYRKLLGPPQPS